ncbi:hypothetical protein [Nonomuraea sp. NPDC050643]|uniref:hypothetical protein n=1 Tax=Nonomuraea sp. NPDC050643 TaxID=3155660 RepID=UPI0033C82C34
MDPIVLAAATALVGAMATDAWQQTRTAVVAWWRRSRPQEAETVQAELDESQPRVLAARRQADAHTEQALTGQWQLRLQRLLDEDPALGPQLRQLLDEHLGPAPAGDEGARVQHIVINAEARDNARQYIAGRDQHFDQR